jgi:hypothetical protein
VRHPYAGSAMLLLKNSGIFGIAETLDGDIGGGRVYRVAVRGCGAGSGAGLRGAQIISRRPVAERVRRVGSWGSARPA